jgi:hypothetical protein
VTSLRIGWATPWNANSAIAQAASDVAAELARHGHAITVLRTETGDALSLPPRPSPWPVHALANIPSDHIRHAFDVVVAHIGDNYGYHGALIPRLRDLGAVGVFHDAFLADLAAQWAYLPGGVGEQALRCAVREAYGEDGWRADEPFITAATILEVARRRPMLEWLAPHTVAAVAHADYYAARLRAACPGPVQVIPLAMGFHDLPPLGKKRPDARTQCGPPGTEIDRLKTPDAAPLPQTMTVMVSKCLERYTSRACTTLPHNGPDRPRPGP